MKVRKPNPHPFGGGIKLSDPIIQSKDGLVIEIITGEKTGTIGAVVGELISDAPPIKPKSTPKP